MPEQPAIKEPPVHMAVHLIGNGQAMPDVSQTLAPIQIDTQDGAFVMGNERIEPDPMKRAPIKVTAAESIPSTQTVTSVASPTCSPRIPSEVVHYDEVLTPKMPDTPAIGKEPAKDKEKEKRIHIHYKDLVIMETIGRGGFGEVKRCVHRELGTFALKVVSVASSDNTKKAIRSELERLKTIKPRFAVRTYEAYYSRTNGTVNFLMEFMDYGSVEKCMHELKRKKLTIPSEDTALIAERVLNALYELRIQHIIHKDIKPDNILIGCDGEVKIGDFGICTFTNKDSEALSGTGSFRWMAPERIVTDKFSYNSDVYSLGFVIAYLALGRVPRGSDTYNEVMFNVVNSDAKIDLSDLKGPDSDTSRLKDFIHKATLRKKEDRPNADVLLEHPFITERRIPPGCSDKNTLSFLKRLDGYAEACERAAKRQLLHSSSGKFPLRSRSD